MVEQEQLMVLVKTKKEARQINKLVDNSISFGEKFLNEYKIQEIVNFNIPRAQLFIAYFARYSILKEDYEKNGSPLERMIRISQNIFAPIDYNERIVKRAAKLFEMSIEMKKESIVSEEESVQANSPLEKEKFVPEQNLSFSQIEAAANLMSSEVLICRKDKSRNLKQAIDSIKTRFKPV